MTGDGRFPPLTLGWVRAELAMMLHCSGMPVLDSTRTFRTVWLEIEAHESSRSPWRAA